MAGAPVAGSGGSAGPGPGGDAGTDSATGPGPDPIPPPSVDAGSAADLAVLDGTPRDVGPPLSNAVAASCTNLPTWRSGVQYQQGADVIHLEPRRRFECRTWPYTPWCALSAYEPGLNRHWPEAWVDRGRCP